MGGSKKQTIGYRYKLGMHLVMCAGPIDKLRAIKFDNKVAFQSDVTEAGTFNVAAEQLFGGESREGGVSGPVDYLPGDSAQGQNSYLASMLGTLIPNFMTVASLVFKQFYFGMNPYLKRIGIRGQRIYVRQNGIEQWYPDKAGIPNAFFSEGTAIEVFTESGVWNRPPGLISATALCIGGGGGGQAGNSQMPDGVGITVGGSGGGGGGASQATIDVADLGETEIVTVGSGGAGGPQTLTPLTTGAAGTTGGDTSFGAHVTAEGGRGGGSPESTSHSGGHGNLAYGGDGGGSAINGSVGGSTNSPPDEFNSHGLPAGAGGGGGAGATQFGASNGGAGGNGQANPDGPPDGALGGAGGSFGDGQPEPEIIATAGSVGSASLIQRGGGGGGGGGGARQGSGAPGADGGIYGGGGGGGGGSNIDGTGAEGGDGAPGICIVVTSFANQDYDMNPAHMLRECITDPHWGMGYNEADVDDANWTVAANRLWDEGFGLSILWDRQKPIEDFMEDIKRHIDAAMYVDRRVGKFRMKLIRNDYDVEDLIHLTPDNIDKVEGFKRRQLGELTTSVTVKFWDSSTNTEASVNVNNIALEQAQGFAITATLNYPMIRSRELALRVAQRDMRVLSSQLASCTVYADRTAKDLQEGDVFLMTWPDCELAAVPMRVSGMAYGDGKNHKLRITCVEDVFSLDDTPVIASVPSGWENPNSPPIPVILRLPFEVPYFEMVQREGQSTVDSNLDATPEVGYVGMAAKKPSASTMNGVLYTDSGSGYLENEVMDFCPTAQLDSLVGRMTTTFEIKNGNSLSQVRIGSWAQIGDEIVSVENVTATEVEVERGCLDTLPAPHSENDVIFFWDDFSGVDETSYVESETIDIKILSSSGSGQIALEEAPVDTLTIVGRAARPYPPGNVQINGEYYPSLIEGEAVLTWAHRDRKQQTSGDLVGFIEGNIGPEDGVTYTLEIYNDSDTLVRTETGITGTTYTYESADESSDGGPFESIRFVLFSVRDGIESYQKYDYRFSKPIELMVTESDETRDTEDGDTRSLE